MSFQDESMIWATDDILGEPSKYGEEGSEVSSKLVKSEFPDDTVISEIVCSLGMHTRSMVDVGKGLAFYLRSKISREGKWSRSICCIQGEPWRVILDYGDRECEGKTHRRDILEE